jgi:hypothetical protein
VYQYRVPFESHHNHDRHLGSCDEGVSVVAVALRGIYVLEPTELEEVYPAQLQKSHH